MLFFLIQETLKEFMEKVKVHQHSRKVLEIFFLLPLHMIVRRLKTLYQNPRRIRLEGSHTRALRAKEPGRTSRMKIKIGVTRNLIINSLKTSTSLLMEIVKTPFLYLAALADSKHQAISLNSA